MTTNDDLDRCLDMYSALATGGDDEQLFMVTIPGAPWSKSRPRFARGRTFASASDVDAERRTASYLKRAVAEPMTGNVAIGCLFFRPNRQRIDADNLLKHVCDAANGTLWLDDSQCTGVMGLVELDVENPRTVVVIGRHSSTLARGTDASYPCVICDGPILLAGGNRAKTCSLECQAIAKGYRSLAVPIPCAHCGVVFKRRVRTATLCSDSCRVEFLRDRRRAAASPMSCCEDCGKELAHKRGGRCRDCWKAHMRVLTTMTTEAIP
jgi:Holliday junction resolvase RusA-like endonuclease